MLATLIADWSVPKDKSDVRRFLGLASYYRRFVKGFSKIVAPMTALLRGKSESIIWTNECELSFLALKTALTQVPVLTIIDPMKGNIVLCTDASDLAIGAVLMQDKRVIAYESRKLSPVELNYSVHEKELLVVIHSLKVWRHYLLGVKFKIETDHQSLRHLSTQPNLSRRQCTGGWNCCKSLILILNILKVKKMWWLMLFLDDHWQMQSHVSEIL
jgi:hypothetical protein